MAGDEWVLGVDIGTSRSAGAIANGNITSLEVEGNRWMPSMLLLDESGTLVVGSAADYQAGVYPDRVERTPKRHLGASAPLLLGESVVDVEDAIARLITVFVEEGKLRHDQAPPSLTVLTHPVRWGDDRKEALAESARRAGLDRVLLIEEPVAAAVHYVGDRVAVGEYVGVYDLGGGTFDTAVLRRTENGFESVGAPGGDDLIGGEHFDHLIYEHLGGCLADVDAGMWEQIQFGDDRKWSRAAADLLTQARRAKEAVSSYPSTQALLPLVDRDIVVTRAQVEAMVRPALEQTIDEMAKTVDSAGLSPEDLKAIYLVGGSSRIPLVTELMTARFGDRIATRDEPKSVVALGAASFARRRLAELSGRTVGPLGATAGRTGDERAAAGVGITRLWGLDLRSKVHGISTAGGDVFVTVEDASLHKIASGGRWQWSVRLAGLAYGRPALGPGTIHVGCSNNLLQTLDATSGAQRWSAATGGAVVTAPVLAGDLVIVADDNQMLAAMSWHDGSLRWLLPLGTGVRAPIAVGRSALLVAGVDGRVFRVEIAGGTATWAFPCPDPVTVEPMVVGDTALIASTGGMVYGIDARTGTALWGRRLGGPIDGQMAFWDRSALVADRSGALTALDRTDGSVQWSVTTGGPNPTGVTVLRSVAFVDNGAGSLVAVDLAGRCELDRMTIGTGAWQPPVAFDDAVVVASGASVVAFRTGN